MNDLREAVQLAENLGEFRGEVRIAGGDYLGDLAEPLEIDRYGGVLSGIVLKGGFAGLAMPGASDNRCLSSFATTLRSGGFGPIVQVNSAAVLTGERLIPPGPFGPLMGFNGARATVFDGLRFVGDQAISVSAEPEAALVVRDCRFMDAQSHIGSGGAIDARLVSLLIESSEFVRCEATARGGAIHHTGGVMIIRDSRFEQNEVNFNDGGAVFVDADATRIERSVFLANKARDPGNFVNRGGAIHVERGEIEIDECLFTANQSDFGGAIYFADAASMPVTTDSDFFQNSAAIGGAIAGGEGVRVAVQQGFFTRCGSLGAGAIDAEYVDIDESEFVNNFGAGAGAISVGSGGVITGSSFHDNSGGQGGAIRIREELDILDCEFVNNSADDGGAVLSSGRGTLTACVFESNLAFDNGGAVSGPAVVSACVLALNTARGFGGAAFGVDSFVDSFAIDNEAESAGGAIYGARFIDDSTIDRNIAPLGPGVVMVDLVRNSRVSRNIDTDTFLPGAAVLASGGHTSVVESSILAGADNDTVLAIDDGSSVIATDSLIVGGARANTTALIELARCTMVGGPNLSGTIVDANNSSVVVLESSVLDGGTTDIDSGALVLLVQSHFSRGRASVKGDPSGLEVFGELSEGDPGFADSTGADANATTWEDNDYSPRGRSQLIDRGFAISGDPSDIDLAGNTRVLNDAGVPNRQVGSRPVDIGAYEFQGTSCPADMNDDGRLSPADFGAWIIAYNLGDRFADQNQDGFISAPDFGAWIINYNLGCD